MRSRIRDYIIYIGIGLIVVLSAVAAAELGVPRTSFMRWYAFSLFSLFLFGQFVLNSKVLWKKRKFWTWTGLAALTHSALFVAVINSGRTIALGVWIICVLIEMALLIGLRSKLSSRT
jgi:hypothetical protein